MHQRTSSIFLSACGSASRPSVSQGNSNRKEKVSTFGGGEAVSKRDFRLHFTLSLWHFLGDLPFYLCSPVLIVGIDAVAII